VEVKESEKTGDQGPKTLGNVNIEQVTDKNPEGRLELEV
jgi:hypothetical protein